MKTYVFMVEYIKGCYVKEPFVVSEKNFKKMQVLIDANSYEDALWGAHQHIENKAYLVEKITLLKVQEVKQ
jgi:hypothetical protein